MLAPSFLVSTDSGNKSRANRSPTHYQPPLEVEAPRGVFFSTRTSYHHTICQIAKLQSCMCHVCIHPSIQSFIHERKVKEKEKERKSCRNQNRCAPSVHSTHLSIGQCLQACIPIQPWIIGPQLCCSREEKVPNLICWPRYLLCSFEEANPL